MRRHQNSPPGDIQTFARAWLSRVEAEGRLRQSSEGDMDDDRQRRDNTASSDDGDDEIRRLVRRCLDLLERDGADDPVEALIALARDEGERRQQDDDDGGTDAAKAAAFIVRCDAKRRGEVTPPKPSNAAAAFVIRCNNKRLGLKG